MLFFQRNLSPLFISRCNSLSLFSLLAPLACLLLSRFSLFLSLHSQFVDIRFRRHGYRDNFCFPFSLYWPFNCLCFTRRGWPCDFPPKKIRVVFGLPYLLIDYFTLVCLWGGQKGVLIHSNQIFLSMVFGCVRFAQERAPLSRYLKVIP